MKDWTNRMDKYLLDNDLDILRDVEKISHKLYMIRLNRI